LIVIQTSKLRGICIVRYLPGLVESIQYYLQSNSDPDLYGKISFLETGIISFLLIILTFALLFFSCLFKKASLFLGIGAAVSAFLIIVMVIIRNLIFSYGFAIGNYADFFALLFLITGCITMGIAYSREKIKKMPVQNQNYRYQPDRPYRPDQRW